MQNRPDQAGPKRGKDKSSLSPFVSRGRKRKTRAVRYTVPRILQKLSNGLPVDIKPVTGEKDSYRIRVGKYRILFVVIEDTLVVTKIGPRGDVYK